jgi:23S rRNA pseudouridine2604 synthase
MQADHAVSEPMRLSKRMAELGLCSRREADEWISRGWVFVDGVRISVLGTKILAEQRITIDRRAASQQNERVTILLNKPIGYVSGQAEDGYQPASVLIKPESRWREDASTRSFDPRQMRSLAPAGRLDIDSTGLLILTQDGRIARQLVGEDSGIEKEYLVRVSGELTDSGLDLLRHGISLDGEPLKPARVNWQNRDQLRFILKQGKKRQLRRMCELVGLTVVGLKRVRIGRVLLGNLPVGQWRYLGDAEGF